MIKTVVRIEPENQALFIKTAKEYGIHIEAEPSKVDYFEITTEYEHTLFCFAELYGYNRGVDDMNKATANLLKDIH